jgi:hypothetical protein
MAINSQIIARWPKQRLRDTALLAPFYGTLCVAGRSVPMKEIKSELTIVSPLGFPLTLKSGQVIEAVGDAASYFGTLTEERRGHSHWQVAVRMLNHALDQPTYLKTATMSLQTALLMEGLLASPLIIGGD